MTNLHPSEGSFEPSHLNSRVRDLRERHPNFSFKDPNREGRSLATTHTRFGQVMDLRSTPSNAPVLVYTDSGAIVSKEHEIGTEKIMGCFGVFISGPHDNALIHMTPKTKLGYEIRPEFNYLERSMGVIEPSLAPLGPLKDCRMVLVANMVSNRYAEEHRRELQAVAEAFRKLGIGHVNVVGDMPLLETTLYFSPERPDELLALGSRVAHDQQGDAVALGGLREHWIPIDEAQPVDFGEMPTPNEVERIKREQWERFCASWRR